MNEYSRLLFARPSLIEGIGRLLDFGGALQEYNFSLTPQQADCVAIWSDWCAVGDDLRRAMAQASQELGADPSQSLLQEAAEALRSALSDSEGATTDR